MADLASATEIFFARVFGGNDEVMVGFRMGKYPGVWWKKKRSVGWFSGALAHPAGDVGQPWWSNF